jgi:hypothetical protein
MEATYTAIATASGDGRDGHVRSDDGRVDLDTRPPAALVMVLVSRADRRRIPRGVDRTLALLHLPER